MSRRIVVAIPAHNEADRIVSCVASIAAQQGAPLPEVLVLLNNCTDGSVDQLRRVAATMPLRVHGVNRNLPLHRASAGTARRLAMLHAARLAGPDGVLLTTDADAVLPPDWLAANLRALAHADAVTGRAVIDPIEARIIPQALHEADARECEYAALLDQIASLLDPDPADPWPRHDEASGASIAVHASAWRRAGGIPATPIGEDRAFIAALRRIDATIRHAPEVWVTVSGRIDGRARGGMADTMRRRMQAADLMLDERLEAAWPAARRASLRRAARMVHAGEGDAGALATALACPALSRLGSGSFGAVWETVEASSPALRRRPVPVSALAAQTRIARELRDRLLSPGLLSPGLLSAGLVSPGPADRAGTSLAAPG